MRKAITTVAVIIMLGLAGYHSQAGAHPARPAPASGGTDCATAHTAGDNHLAVDWPVGAGSPIDTYAGPAPSQDLFGVLSCGDGRHVEWEWFAGSPKPSFTWGIE